MKLSLGMDMGWVRVSFLVANDIGHDSHLASYTIAENKWSFGEI